MTAAVSTRKAHGSHSLVAHPEPPPQQNTPPASPKIGPVVQKALSEILDCTTGRGKKGFAVKRPRSPDALEDEAGTEVQDSSEKETNTTVKQAKGTSEVACTPKKKRKGAVSGEAHPSAKKRKDEESAPQEPPAKRLKSAPTCSSEIQKAPVLSLADYKKEAEAVIWKIYGEISPSLGFLTKGALYGYFKLKLTSYIKNSLTYSALAELIEWYITDLPTSKYTKGVEPSKIKEVIFMLSAFVDKIRKDSASL